MTLDEAIAESAARTIRATDNRETWVTKMLAWARDEDGYAWGVIAGAYEARASLVRERLRTYWRTHGPPAQPEPEDEWREFMRCDDHSFTVPAEGRKSRNLYVARDGPGLRFGIRGAEELQFRIRWSCTDDGPPGGFIIERRQRTGGDGG